MSRALRLAIAALPLAAAMHAVAGDAAKGKTLYDTTCAVCHSPDRNSVGPAHRGVFGRKAGTAPGYSYSSAVASSGVVWNDEALDKWLTDPEKFIPGEKMGVSVRDAAARQDLIAYLKTLNAK